MPSAALITCLMKEDVWSREYVKAKLHFQWCLEALHCFARERKLPADPGQCMKHRTCWASRLAHTPAAARDRSGLSGSWTDRPG